MVEKWPLHKGPFVPTGTRIFKKDHPDGCGISVPNVSSKSWFCDLEKGHEGPHLACIGDRIIYRWDGIGEGEW